MFEMTKALMTPDRTPAPQRDAVTQEQRFDDRGPRARTGLDGVVRWYRRVDVKLPRRPVPFHLASVSLPDGSAVLAELPGPVAPGSWITVTGRNRAGDLTAAAA